MKLVERAKIEGISSVSKYLLFFIFTSTLIIHLIKKLKVLKNQIYT
jgi:hypothetical protein